MGYMFRKIYNNLELCEDKEFKKYLIDKYKSMDCWFYKNCVEDAKVQHERYLSDLKKK